MQRQKDRDRPAYLRICAEVGFLPPSTFSPSHVVGSHYMQGDKCGDRGYGWKNGIFYQKISPFARAFSAVFLELLPLLRVLRCLLASPLPLYHPSYGLHTAVSTMGRFVR